MRKALTQNVRHIVVKVGTSILTKNGSFDKPMTVKLADEVCAFLKKKVRVALVSSGAIGAGMTILKEKKRPKTMEGLQAAAAVGQRCLMQCYEEAFSKRGFSTAQVLLTWEDLADPKRFMNAKRTLNEIRRRGIVPVINENDTVATEEIRFGDNDRLSALISILIETDALIILSDTNGLYADGHGSGKRLPVVEKVDSTVFRHVKDRKTDVTRGGMRSKLNAVLTCTSSGIPVFLADGRQKGVLKELFSGTDLGTFFPPVVKKGRLRKNWIYHFLNHVNVR